MNVKIFQFNGCDKCFNEALLLKLEKDIDVEYITDPKSWSGEKIDVAVITGYLLPEDRETLIKIDENANKVIGYGDCPATGGVYGLANQKGHKVTSINKFEKNVININSCLGEYEELLAIIKDEELPKLKNLCQVCKRKSTCEFLDEVKRQIDPNEDEEICFNDLGFLCNGYIAKECKERCIDHGTQCRGCKFGIQRPGIRMLGMFGTLMGNIEVATEASKYGATDKLADKDDDVTGSLPDIVGNFFRFTLPTSGLPHGRIPTSGTLLEDVFIGRLIEEIPLITGLLGGKNAISLTLNVIETYEKGANIKVSEQTKKYREELKKLEKDMQNAIDKKDAAKYKETTDKIREIAGNMNLSNIFFGGFKTKIKEADNFDDYKTQIFEMAEGSYKNGVLEYVIDSNGIIKEIKIKEE